jgi:hypothetical protein
LILRIGLEQKIPISGDFTSREHTVNPALLTSNFAWQIQLSILQISLFKVIRRKYFSQGKI